MTIKEARLQVGLTEEELADYLGISPEVLKLVEAGKKQLAGWIENHLVEETLKYKKK